MNEVTAAPWHELTTAPPSSPAVPPARQALTGPALLVALALALAWTGRQRLPLLMVAVAVVVAVVGLASPRFRSGVWRVGQAVATWVGPVFAWIFLLPLYVLLITPVALLLRALRVRPLERGTDETSSSLWMRAVKRPRCTVTRMFSDERAWRPVGAVRTSRAVVARTVLAVLVGQALIVGVVFLAANRSDPEPELAGTVSMSPGESAALRDQPWIQQVLAEQGEVSQGIVYAPFVGSTVRDYAGEYVNVSRRARASYEPTVPPGVDPVDVWFFGGSTMFGFDAQRDLHTIPSEFARLAERFGIPVRVRNYGSPGYVNYQETALLGLLVSGGERPDLVIFYDGINDFSLQLVNAVGGLNPVGEPSDLGTSQQREALFDSGAVPGGSAEPPEPLTSDSQKPFTATVIADAVARVYEQGMDVSAAVATQHGFEVQHYWQPTIYTREPLDPGEQAVLPAIGFDQYRFETMAALSSRVAGTLPDGVTDITDALDSVEGPVLADNAHINEVGARAVAEAIFVNERARLERLSEGD